MNGKRPAKIGIEAFLLRRVYDEKGDYDGNAGPPPQNSPIGIT